ncbi:MAG: alpha/beta hydrolase [Propionibacteriaceae bacterium]|jgi:alpha-beta hydrolase superfamily lysophospholipase|nr:alpha/beta hydrolase [Propionibacteriaceae bacterium]
MSDDVTTSESFFPSAGRFRRDVPAQIAVTTWAPPGPPKAVLQLNHGMAEHIDRYDALARLAAGRGYLVVGMDFIGHGDSVEDPAQLGHAGLPMPSGRNVFLEDMGELRRRTQAQYPDLPYFMFGHSMGSFVLRAYLEDHGENLAGAIICGSGAISRALLAGGQCLLWAVSLVRPPDYRSKLFFQMSLGQYNKPFAQNARTEFDWLSRDPAEVDLYLNDPRCAFLFSLTANAALLDASWRAGSPAAFTGPPLQLPLLIVSGACDPVGGMGAGVTGVARQYERAGKDVTLKLYDDVRHEIINDYNRDAVMADLLDWLDGRVTAA